MHRIGRPPSRNKLHRYWRSARIDRYAFLADALFTSTGLAAGAVHQGEMVIVTVVGTPGTGMGTVELASAEKLLHPPALQAFTRA